jgi:Uma2 family endonuclease
VSAAAVPKLYSFEEFCEVIEDGQKADLIDGEIFLSSPDSVRANNLQSFIQVLLDGFSEAQGGLGSVYVSRVALRLGSRNGPEPDVAFVLREHSERVKLNHIQGAPDIVVEIVSEDSRHRDYVRKRALYQDAGAGEYWVLNPLDGAALFLRLRNGEFESIELENGRYFRSGVLPGFWLDVRWLFQDPLPPKFECLQRILAGDPES